jgi:hypothetical protein
MVSQPHAPSRKGYPYAVTRNGLTYVFETAEEQAAFLDKEMSSQDRIERAWHRLDELDRRILSRTGGQGIPANAVDDAVEAMRDH